MTPWTPDQLIEATQGRWLTAPAGEVSGRISTDTRTITPGDIFIALKGENHDAHDHLEQAFEKGAAVIVASDEGKAQSAIANHPTAMLLVPDTLEALQDLARFHRHRLHKAGVTVIAITGSNGKTTTRNLIHTVLSAHPQRGRGSQSLKSFNNHIGVPLTLLAASADDDFVVVEVGTNHPGEIAHLADIIRPEAAVITNIGTAHIGYFGSRRAIAKEKAALLRYVQNHGLAVIPDESLLPAPPAHLTTVRIGTDLRCIAHQPAGLDEPTRFVVASEGETCNVTFPLHGQHNITNALCALAVGRWYDINLPRACEALSHATAVDMRSQIVTCDTPQGPVTVINDAYNANPDSMRAAIDLLASSPTQGRRVAIVGDMFELGDSAGEAHRAVGRQIKALSDKIDLTILIGPMAQLAAEALDAEQVVVYDRWQDDLPQHVKNLLRGGDLVLLKASRGMALERLLAQH